MRKCFEWLPCPVKQNIWFLLSQLFRRKRVPNIKHSFFLSSICCVWRTNLFPNHFWNIRIPFPGYKRMINKCKKTIVHPKLIECPNRPNALRITIKYENNQPNATYICYGTLAITVLVRLFISLVAKSCDDENGNVCIKWCINCHFGTCAQAKKVYTSIWKLYYMRPNINRRTQYNRRRIWKIWQHI